MLDGMCHIGLAPTRYPGRRGARLYLLRPTLLLLGYAQQPVARTTGIQMLAGVALALKVKTLPASINASNCNT